MSKDSKTITNHHDAEWLQVLLASVGDAVIATDVHGRVTLLNPIAEKLTGWRNDDAYGQPLETVFRIINEKTRQIVANPVEKVFETGRVVGLANHTILIARDGTECAIDDSAAPIRDRQGHLIGVVLVFRDVTEQRKAQETMRFLAAIVESSDDAIISKDVNGNVTSWNRAAERLFGYTAEEMIGRPISAIAPPNRTDEMPTILARIRRGEQVEHFDTVRQAKGGQLLDISLTVSPIKDDDGNIIGASKIARDISDRKRAQEALAAERARLHTTLVSIGDGVIVSDASGHITLINSMAQKLTGWSEEEAAGRPLNQVFRIINENTRQPVDNPIDRILRGTTIIGLADHTLLIAKDGTEIPIDNSGAPIRDSEGNVVAVVLVFRDIRARRRSEERLRLLWEAASTLLTSNEPDAMLRELFARIGEHLGLDAYLCHLMVDGSLQLASCHGVNRDVAASVVTRELERSIRASGRRTLPPLEATRIQQSKDPAMAEFRSLGLTSLVSNPLQVDEDLIGVLTFASRADRELDEDDLEFLRTINQYVSVAYSRLRLVQELREADRKKDEFLATLAHELRNPLAPIRSGLELIGLSDDASLLKEIRATMERQVEQMVHLIDDLLDVSRITQGKLQLRKQRLILDSVIQSAVEASRPLIDKHGHQLTVTMPDQPVYLEADPTRLAQSVSNLLNNSAKYSDPGGRIWLTVSQTDKEVLISVRDTGIGIDPKQLPQIFEKFSQETPALERAQGGLGIGLSIVKGLIELHGGSVEARSGGVGKGSEFTVRLPAACANAPPMPPNVDWESNVAVDNGLKILVVDDNRDAANNMATLLRLMGYKTNTAYDGLEAIQAAASLRPDIVVLDIGLPKMNGYESAHYIREQPWGMETVLIALSGWGQEEDKRRASDSGFDHHLTKPADTEQLRKLLVEIGANKRLV